MSKKDTINSKLIESLMSDATKSSVVLSKELKVSSATIRRKIKRLISSKTLNIIGIVDPAKIGFPLAAVINLDVSQDKLEEALDFLTGHPEIQWFSATTGRFDIMAIGWFSSINHIHDFMTNKLIQLEGLRDSETSLCLNVKKNGQLKSS
ncbi:Lrp/AsnC family transcriptional regulator [Chloroflexota bacterium]